VNQVLWYATRGAGVVTVLMLTGVVVLGVVTTVRWQSKSWPRFLSAELHRGLALLSLVFLAIHIVTAIVDPFTSLGWLAAVIPFWSAYRRLWLGLGVVAFDLLLALVITSLLRHVLGHRAWRSVHWLAYAAWPIALVHGIGTGTDTLSTWMLAINATCVAAVAVAVLWRLWFAWTIGGVRWTTQTPAADRRRWPE
jgi:sulfoxide reductase heme-binding subunit YedZ